MGHDVAWLRRNVAGSDTNPVSEIWCKGPPKEQLCANRLTGGSHDVTPKVHVGMPSV